MRPSIVAPVVLAISLHAALGRAQEEEAPPAKPPVVVPVAVPVAVAPVVAAAPPAKSFPAVGGHLGFALPIVSFGSKTEVIGADFVKIGLTPGVTVHLDDEWAVDFEFVALNELKNTPAVTTWVVDPGVIRKFDAVSVGLRVATQVGAPTNVGLVPIVVVPIAKSDKVKWYIEGDVPAFLRDGGNAVHGTVGFQFQSGIAF